jgi:hypothetical protein
MWPSSARNRYMMVTERLQRRRRKLGKTSADVFVVSAHFQMVSV